MPTCLGSSNAVIWSYVTQDINTNNVNQIDRPFSLVVKLFSPC